MFLCKHYESHFGDNISGDIKIFLYNQSIVNSSIVLNSILNSRVGPNLLKRDLCLPHFY